MRDPITELIQDEVDNHGVSEVDDLDPTIYGEILARRLESLTSEHGVGTSAEAYYEGTTADIDDTWLVGQVENAERNPTDRRRVAAMIGEEIIQRFERFHKDWLQGLIDEAVRTSDARQLRKQREADVDNQIHERKWGVA